jgi:hypothetical protein
MDSDFRRRPFSLQGETYHAYYFVSTSGLQTSHIRLANSPPGVVGNGPITALFLFLGEGLLVNGTGHVTYYLTLLHGYISCLPGILIDYSFLYLSLRALPSVERK